MKLQSILPALLATVLVGQAADVEIVKRGAAKSPIDLSGLRLPGTKTATTFADTLRNDLRLSGWFTLSPPGDSAIVVGGTLEETRGRLVLRCTAENRSTGRRYFSETFKQTADEARTLAHAVNDRIVSTVKNVPGIASTRVAMVGLRDRKKDIYLCDADGAGFLRMTRQGAVCIAPNWWPDGTALVYTSFHGGFPDVYRLDLRTYRREKIAGFPGLNAGADISPDGRSMALALSKDGNPELYVMDVRTRALTRLTRTRFAAEASPTWSPDGNSIAFVSDRSGNPQLYVLRRGGEAHKNLTFRSGESVAPDWGPDGRITYSHRSGGRYNIAVLDPRTGKTETLTRGDADYEDPSWARDGRHIVCSRTEGFHSDLYILDTMGDPPLRLTRLPGDWYSPAWSQK